MKLQLWDIAGQETFKFLSKSFYENAVGAFVVTDLTRWETLGTAFYMYIKTLDFNSLTAYLHL